MKRESTNKRELETRILYAEAYRMLYCYGNVGICTKDSNAKIIAAGHVLRY